MAIILPQVYLTRDFISVDEKVLSESRGLILLLAVAIYRFRSSLFVQANQIPNTVNVKGRVTAQYIQNWLLTNLPGCTVHANIGMAKSDYPGDQHMFKQIYVITYSYKCSR